MSPYAAIKYLKAPYLSPRLLMENGANYGKDSTATFQSLVFNDTYFVLLATYFQSTNIQNKVCCIQYHITMVYPNWYEQISEMYRNIYMKKLLPIFQ